MGKMSEIKVGRMRKGHWDGGGNLNFVNVVFQKGPFKTVGWA